jgi:hypothetical protein
VAVGGTLMPDWAIIIIIAAVVLFFVLLVRFLIRH